MLNRFTYTSIMRFCVFLLLLFYYDCSQCEASDHCINLQSSLINDEVKRDLEMFEGHNKLHAGLLAQFDSTVTKFGKTRLHHHVEHPINDLLILKTRQSQIQYLLDHPELVNQLKEIFAEIKKNENGLSYFVEGLEDSVASKTIESLYFQSNLFKKFNQSAWALNVRNIAKHATIMSPIIEHLIFHFALEYIQNVNVTGARRQHDDHSQCHHDDHHNHDAHHHDHSRDHHHEHAHAHCIHDLKPAAGASKFVRSIFTLLKVGHLGMHLMSMKEIYHTIASQQNVVNELHQKVDQAKRCLSLMAQCSDIMKKHACLDKILGLNNECIAFFNSTKTSENKDLILLAREPKSKQKTIKFLSSIGKTLKQYRILKEHASSMTNMLKTLGDLEALISIVDWITRINKTKSHICCVNFIECIDKPTMAVKGLWNIALNPQEVVHNDIMFNDASIIILSGANKGGKSCIIKALGLNIWLAHVFGIAAADAMDMPLFAKLCTNIIVTDDTCHDTSMMVAELKKAEECLKTIAKLKKNEYAFVLIDDSLFKGTVHEKGEKLAYQFIESLGQEYRNCCAIVATHTPSLTELECNYPNIFKNYKIKVGKDDRGRTFSTFCIEPGIADSSLVFDIIRSQKLSSLFNYN